MFIILFFTNIHFSVNGIGHLPKLTIGIIFNFINLFQCFVIHILIISTNYAITNYKMENFMCQIILIINLDVINSFSVMKMLQDAVEK